jgi:hypothetical protein
VDEGGCSYTKDPCAREDKDFGDRAQTEAERRSDVSEGTRVGGDVWRRSRKQRRVKRGLMTVVPDEHSLESCESNGLVQEHIEGQEKANIAELAANLEKAGTWYYVVDCATCKALIPFKYTPEDEPVLCFPTMTVRCFHCHTAHTYAPGLISHRKAVPPREILQRDRPPSDGDDGDQEASGDRQEDRGSEERVIVERETDSLSSSPRRTDILMAAVSGMRAIIFFWSSCFFVAAWVLELALHAFDPLRSSGPAVLLTTGYFGSIMFGLLLFIFGMGSLFSRHAASNIRLMSLSKEE